jgi:hypothetical protein
MIKANNQNSWGGKGAKKSKKNPKFLVKTAGIEPALRKDFTTSNVIITEKKDRKAAAFQVKDLPYPYTSVEQFEARFKTPLGSEWNSRAVHQKETMPRVVKKVCFLFTSSSLLSWLNRRYAFFIFVLYGLLGEMVLTYSLVRLSSLSEGYSKPFLHSLLCTSYHICCCTTLPNMHHLASDPL